MANGNGSVNGVARAAKERFTRVDDLILKIGAGVVTAVIVAMLLFGMKVYGFMAQGDRFTAEMHTQSVDEAWVAAREEFTHSDVYERDREYLDRRLDRIEEKLDQLLEER